MRRSGSPPVIVERGRSVRALERLRRAHGEFDEKFLQNLLAENPELLPVHDLRDDVGTPVLIGREVSAGASCWIDNLYLTTGGYVVVVETKLWRNPEARREVLSNFWITFSSSFGRITSGCKPSGDPAGRTRKNLSFRCWRA
ncbi:MAG TPA: hypothetical protein VGM03_05475 [Phycisphaerae bacterium]